MDITADRADRRGFPLSGIALAMQPFIGGSGETWAHASVKIKLYNARPGDTSPGALLRLR